MRVKAVHLEVDTSQLARLDTESITNFIAGKVENGFREKLGPLLVQAAQSKAPTSEGRDFQPGFNPRLKGSKAFQPVELIERVAPGRNIGEKIARLKALQEGATEVDLDNDAEFFRIKAGPKDRPNRDAGQTPTKLAFRSGAVVGAVQHKPGTLRRSIKMRGVRREGNRVILTVVATAPYAHRIHEGWMYRGGWTKKTGKPKRIAPQRYFKQALAQIRDHIKSPSTYR